ncbi:MAG: hypothetical protein AAFN77_01600 [Planctomycetota bacterium]
MTAAVANLINSLVLIGIGLWGYFGVEDPSKTALIPVGFGIVLLLMVPGVLKHNKVIAHIAVGLTLLILLALIMPLLGAIKREDSLAIARVAAMMVSCAAAMGFFVKSFIDARKAREADGVAKA